MRVVRSLFTVRRLEMIINGFAIAAIVYVGVAMVMRRVDQQKRPVSADRRLTTGSDLKVAGVTWPADKDTLVFVLQVGCKYCAKSMPFYRGLAGAIQREGKLHTLAILPQNTREADAYMSDNRIPIAETRQANLMDLGIAGTPTLILVDNTGKVIQSWTGFLDHLGTEDVLARLKVSLPLGHEEESTSAAQSGSAAAAIVYTSELLSLLGADPSLRIIDARNRVRFGNGHIQGAYNIPAEELAARFPHEIGKDRSTLVYCGYSEYCAVSGFSTLCAHAASELKRINVNIRVIRDKLPQLKTAGVQIAGSAEEPNGGDK